MRDGKISDTTFELLPRTQQNSLIESQFTAADQDPIDGSVTSHTSFAKIYSTVVLGTDT